MPKPLARKKVELKEYPLTNRDEVNKRLAGCKDNIHSPWSWYRQDVLRLLAVADILYTENQYLKSQQKEEPSA